MQLFFFYLWLYGQSWSIEVETPACLQFQLILGKKMGNKKWNGHISTQQWTAIQHHALHHTVLHNTALNNTILYKTAPTSKTLHCTTIQHAGLHYTAQRYSTLHCIALEFTTLQYVALHHTKHTKQYYNWVPAAVRLRGVSSGSDLTVAPVIFFNLTLFQLRGQ